MRARLLALLSFERGAILWIPALWIAAAGVLFAIVQASSDHVFNHTRDLRVALGPVESAGVSDVQRVDFESGLSAGLGRLRELTVVDRGQVRGRLHAVLGAPLPHDARRWISATRSLNVRYWLNARLAPHAAGLEAELSVWEVSPAREIGVLSGFAADPRRLGDALADSLGVVLFRPRSLRPARPTPPERSG